MEVPSFIQIHLQSGRQRVNQFIQRGISVEIVVQGGGQYIISRFTLPQLQRTVPNGMKMCGCYLVANRLNSLHSGVLQITAIGFLTKGNVLFGELFFFTENTLRIS